MAKKYDIFISYRRIDNEGNISGRDIARTIKLEFEKRHYKVFYDYSEIKDNEFESTIIPAIRESKYFLLVLSKDALVRCKNENDWVRREIEEAIYSGCKIIPVSPDNQFKGWPSTLPDDISTLRRIHVSEVALGSLFEKSIDKLIDDRIINQGSEVGNDIRYIINEYIKACGDNNCFWSVFRTNNYMTPITSDVESTGNHNFTERYYANKLECKIKLFYGNQPFSENSIGDPDICNVVLYGPNAGPFLLCITHEHGMSGTEKSEQILEELEFSIIDQYRYLGGGFSLWKKDDFQILLEDSYGSGGTWSFFNITKDKEFIREYIKYIKKEFSVLQKIMVSNS